MHWPRLSTEEIKKRVFQALSRNLNYRSEKILGIPATFLDEQIFYEDAPFLKDAPFMSALIANPNHIGCHTLEGETEAVFRGTQEMEKDLIRICAEEIFSAAPGNFDGYVASGGTEANIEAMWIYRNYFVHEAGAVPGEITMVFSEDSHYSFHKAANLLGLQAVVFAVGEKSRETDIADLRKKIERSLEKGTKHFIVNVNLGTTMFGSVDDIEGITGLLTEMGVSFRLHVDAAFGGFIYPFTREKSRHDFGNPHVSSITVDGHKLLQAPYGTGIFLVRKGLMHHVRTEQASYVQGKDYTLCGSRSGANAVCVWMILHMHGSVGWTVRMERLLDTTTSLCSSLKSMGIEFYRHPNFNIITIRAAHVSPAIAENYMLVPDDHNDPKWYKIVVMTHVRHGVLDSFVSDMRAARSGGPGKVIRN